MKHRVLIIGCGNIAGELDFNHNHSERLPITHAKAYKRNPNFEIVACIDENQEQLSKFQKEWSINKGFLSIEEAISKELEIDVVSICSPTNCREEHLNLVLSLNPKLVFCEKPIHFDVKAAKKLILKYKDKNVHLQVNYNRRFDQSVHDFKKSIESSEYGKIRVIRGWYNKGLLNNGSHCLDLLSFLFGSLFIKNVGNGINDYDEKDLSYPLYLSTQDDVPIFLSCGNASDFSLVELEFLFSNGRIKMLNGGRRWSFENVIEDSTFNGYKILGDIEFKEGKYLESFSNAVSNIHNCLIKQEKLKSNSQDALKVLNLCSEILEKT